VQLGTHALGMVAVSWVASYANGSAKVAALSWWLRIAWRSSGAPAGAAPPASAERGMIAVGGRIGRRVPGASARSCWVEGDTPMAIAREHP